MAISSHAKLLSLLVGIVLVAAGPAAASNNCNVVQHKQGNSGLSTSVTAGNGRVSAQSDGNSVAVRSGNGSTSTATTGNGGQTTTVTNSSGNCTTSVNSGGKKED